jgi:hypothetical protein
MISKLKLRFKQLTKIDKLLIIAGMLLLFPICVVFAPLILIAICLNHALDFLEI